MSTLSYTKREQGNKTYFDLTGFTPSGEVNAQISCEPGEGNSGTESANFGLHNTADKDGNVTFSVPTDEFSSVGTPATLTVKAASDPHELTVVEALS